MAISARTILPSYKNVVKPHVHDISIAIPSPMMQPVWRLSPKEQAALEACGWVSTRRQSISAEAFKLALLTLARHLGTPMATRSRDLVDTLMPTQAEDAHPNSLSRMTSTGQQPWHMDMAHRTEPARYLVMGMHQSTGDTASTELLDASTLVPDAFKEEALSEPFLLRTGARSFYATVIAKGQPYVRFDPGCMQGVTTRAKMLMQRILDQALTPTHTHHWESGSVLVIDNWKMLHRRADATKSINRTLYRVSVIEGTT
ncbi:hypothetical protein GO290_01927 [Ralstonia solanacearum]|nr:hypothetical protein [Ralstonia solanacearum]